MAEEEVPEKEDMIARANQAAARLEAANKHAEELARRRDADATREILSGESEAGQEPPKPKEETNTEYVDRVMRDGKDTKPKGA